MQYSRLSLAVMLSSMSLVLAEPIVTSPYPLATASGGALDSTHPVTAPTPTGHVDVASGPLTISVHNSEGFAVSVTYGSNAGAPTLLSQPGSKSLASGGNARFVAPNNWAGRIIVGKSFNVDGSKIEASFMNSKPFVDVSYVDGYTTAIVCSCDNRVVTGCNVPLFSQHSCPNPGEGGNICYNPARNTPNGPPTAFFAPCRGAAYTYPNDNGAVAACTDHTIYCCVGPQCPRDPKQP